MNKQTKVKLTERQQLFWRLTKEVLNRSIYTILYKEGKSIKIKEVIDDLSIDIKENGNLLLGVHIADPLDLIDIDSIIFEETSKRTTSIYLSDKTIPMFPEEIGSDLASLKEKNYRPAISYYFEFDKNGNIFIGKEKIASSKLKNKLLTMLKQNPKLSIVISGDTKTQYGKVIEVMSNLKSAGFKKVGLKTEPFTKK